MEAATATAPERDIHEDWRAELAAYEPHGEGREGLLAKLDYWLEQARRLREEIEAREAMAGLRIERIKAHTEAQNDASRSRLAWIEQHVRGMVPPPDRIQEETGKKSINLPNGTVGYRAKSATVEVDDNRRALEWVKEKGIPYSERITESVTKTPILEYIERTGEVPGPESGIMLVDEHEDFYLDLGD